MKSITAKKALMLSLILSAGSAFAKVGRFEGVLVAKPEDIQPPTGYWEKMTGNASMKKFEALGAADKRRLAKIRSADKVQMQKLTKKLADSKGIELRILYYSVGYGGRNELWVLANNPATTVKFFLYYDIEAQEMKPALEFPGHTEGRGIVVQNNEKIVGLCMPTDFMNYFECFILKPGIQSDGTYKWSFYTTHIKGINVVPKDVEISEDGTIFVKGLNDKDEMDIYKYVE